MLNDEFLAYRANFTYPDGTSYDACLERVKRRIRAAQAFVLDRDAVGMAANVAISKPSSIVSALPFVKLPFDPMWLEFSNLEFRDAMAEAGSPNLQHPNTKSEIRKSGFLLSEKLGILQADYVHLDRANVGGRMMEIPDLSPVRTFFVLDRNADVAQIVPKLDPRALDPNNLSGKVHGRMRSHFKLLASDPDELKAAAELKARVYWSPHPDMAPIAAAMRQLVGEAQTTTTEANQGEEATRLFLMAVLPALILINCRNAVDIEVVPAPEKLNKQRAQKGKEPLLEHRIVKMHLTATRKRRMGDMASADERRAARATLVMGHYKVRKTGVFWWRPHPRTGRGKPIRRTVVVTS